MIKYRKNSMPEKSLQGHIHLFSLRARKRNFSKMFSQRVSNAVFLDIDGTIWPDNGHGALLREVCIDPQTKRSIRQMRKYFDFIVLVSNQTLFARMSLVRREDFDLYFQNIRFLQKHLKFDLYLACHHHINAQNHALKSSCDFRKPGVEMFLKAQDVLGLNLNKCATIGDRITDVISSTDAGISSNFVLANARVLEMNEGKKNLRNEGYVFRVASSLQQILDLLKRDSCD